MYVLFLYGLLAIHFARKFGGNDGYGVAQQPVGQTLVVGKYPSPCRGFQPVYHASSLSMGLHEPLCVQMPWVSWNPISWKAFNNPRRKRVLKEICEL